MVAVVRNPSKAEALVDRGVNVRPGEYGDPEGLRWSFSGVSALFLISGMAGPEERRKQHRGAIEAAKKAGVERIVYTSFIDAEEDSPFFAWSINRDTEAALKESGLAYTVLRNGMYSEADLDYVPEYLEFGKVENNIGDGRISYISRRDLALAAARCLLDDGHAGRTYSLTGPEAISQTRLAELISRWTGREVPYQEISDEEYRRSFADPYWGDVVVTLYESVRLGYCEMVTEDFRTIVGRDAYTLDETWERHYADSFRVSQE
jgi:NAD(P)H dehydrogenase (quinone)